MANEKLFREEMAICVRGRGRPVIPLFVSDEVERDFRRRAHRAVEQFFDTTDAGGKKPWKLADGAQMGSGAFWAFVCRIYAQESTEQHPRCIFPHMEAPLMPRLLWARIAELLQTELGTPYVSDRSGMDRVHQAIECRMGEYLLRLQRCKPDARDVIAKDERFAHLVADLWGSL